MDSINCKIENNIIETDALGINTGLNFGRFDHYAGEPQKYSITITISHFIQLMEDQYNIVKDEIKADDKLNNDNSEFSQVGYCSLKDLIDEHEEEVVIIVSTYLRDALFDKLLNNSGNVRYVINSLDGILRKDDVLEITGKSYTIPSK